MADWQKNKLAAKLLGRPSAKAVAYQIRPGGRNHIEGKIGQGNNKYRINRIRARLKNTSQSWIASIILVLNLVRLAKVAQVCLGFSAWQSRLLQYFARLEALLINLKTKTQSNCDSGLGYIACAA